MKNSENQAKNLVKVSPVDWIKWKTVSGLEDKVDVLEHVDE
jgi:hypothetical protein